MACESGMRALTLETFRCEDCMKELGVRREGGTGYCIFKRPDGSSAKVCYECCADRDREQMLKKGEITLYLVQTDKVDRMAPGLTKPKEWEVTNWPGTLRIRVSHVKTSWHNMAGRDGRRDFWFNGLDGHIWHGYNICGRGSINQIAHCKRTKERWRKEETRVAA